MMLTIHRGHTVDLAAASGPRPWWEGTTAHTFATVLRGQGRDRPRKHFVASRPQTLTKPFGSTKATVRPGTHQSDYVGAWAHAED